ncbi:glycosyltransferase [Synechococcus sp. J7-Johnson]|uniref:glycosyltransferase n=1 Tax=Synechococcus sp. J7-Johnson TaxID=2823737 RepID=UPI0020CC9C77|nr:glycosyltransferase [Synechococcus sp. J7-Johnson]MCP9839911.1 glycosyltransferase [Synechococcus sp. J7-Johnson]
MQSALSSAGIAIDDIEAVYSPFCDYLFSLPRTNQVITCHDLTPLSFPNSRKAWTRYKLWTPVHLQRAKKIVAISGFVADQLVALGVPASKVEVVFNGIALERPRLISSLSHDLIMLARHDANKNVPFVVRAFGQFLEQQPDWPGRLVVVGRSGRQTPILRALQRSLSQPERVEFVEALSRSTLVERLRKAFALVSASVMEGFDYPVLEAKAEGLPTLISRIPVHRELHSDSSLFFGLDDEGAQFRDALILLAQNNDLWSELSNRGYRLASRLDLSLQQQGIQAVLGAVSQ